MDVKEYQSGYYCKQSFLKFIIADAGLSMPNQIFTSLDVEKITGIHRKKVGNALWHYKKVDVPYFRRLMKKAPNGLIRWQVIFSLGFLVKQMTIILNKLSCSAVLAEVIIRICIFEIILFPDIT